ncbi:MAG: ribonuclease III family protein [Candidatus Thorarchaeota archaeon]
MYQPLIDHDSIAQILNDKGLAKIGDNLVNFMYSLAKSIVLGSSTGEKVRDSVLARAIRSTSVYEQIGHRTDAGTAGDAYEAIVAYLWLTKELQIDSIVDMLVNNLPLDSHTSRRAEGRIAATAFKYVMTHLIDLLPPSLLHELD